MFKRLWRFIENLKRHDMRRGWRLGLLSLAFAMLITYTLRLAVNYTTWHDFSILKHLSFPMFLLNALIVLLVLNVCHALSNRWIFSAGLVSYVSTFLIILNICKLKMLDIPLVPGDIYLVSQFLELIPHLLRTRGVALGTLALSLLLSVPFFIWLFRMRWHSGSRRYRLGAGLGSMGLIVSMLIFRIITDQNDKFEEYFTWYDWDQKVNYEKNGFFFSTFANLTTFINPVHKPKDYSGQAVDEIFRRYQPLAEGPTRTDAVMTSGNATRTGNAVTSGSATRTDAGVTSGPANVIVCLTEAFWDIDKLNVKLTNDPIPFFHSLEKTCASGWLHVPTYGGYTAQPEFEILTGFSMDYLPEMSNPYQSYINLNRRLPTLPNIFRRNHYSAYAVHPFKRQFYSRAKAYPLLGFEKFFDINTFRHRQTSGPYISDEMLTDKIIEISDMGSPYFLFSISMSTHGPFDYDDFLKEPLDVLTPMKPESHNQVKTYINAIARTDKALKRLIEHFSQAKQKTLIVIFGDHMPMLGDNMSVYRELNYLKSKADAPKVMHSTPIVAWANYKLPATPLPDDAYMLFPYILEAAGIKPTGYAKYMDGALHYGPMNDTTSATLHHDLEMVQYDILFGKQYALAADDTALAGGGLAETIKKHQEEEAHPKEMIIKDYGPTNARVGEKFNVQPGGHSAFWFQTENITEDSVAMLNETELATTVSDNGKVVTAVTAADILTTPGLFHVYLMDKKTRRKSNEMRFFLRSDGSEKLTPPPVTNWGPRSTVEGEDFNVQAEDNFSAIWFTLKRPAKDLTVFINNRPMPTMVGEKGLITVSVAKNFYMKAGDCKIEIQDNPTGKRSEPLIFKVLSKSASQLTSGTTATAGARK